MPRPFEFGVMAHLAGDPQADFARAAGIASVTTHVGFIPENPRDPVYAEVVAALRYLAGYCRSNGQEFWLETGQETPVRLLRTIEEVGTGNVGINLDPANLLLYGKGNPVDALDVFGRYVRGVHVKDGDYPTDGRSLGRERPVGEGRVDFAALLGKLHGLGYTGALTIEREISGEQQIRDIRRAVEHLTPMVGRLTGKASWNQPGRCEIGGRQRQAPRRQRCAPTPPSRSARTSRNGSQPPCAAARRRARSSRA